MAAQAEAAITYDRRRLMRDPAVETLPGRRRRADDAAYRAQIAYLFERSRFYREKLAAAGFPDARSVGGLADIAGAAVHREGRAARQPHAPRTPIGTHLAAPMADVARIYSTSGTTGAPSYIPLTRTDLEDWIEISRRSYAASGLRAPASGWSRPTAPGRSWRA